MKELEDYLAKYFKDWELSKEEELDLIEICKTASNQLKPLYSLMQQMAESTKVRESVIDKIDETLTEQKDDIKTDT